MADFDVVHFILYKLRGIYAVVTVFNGDESI